MASGKRSNWSAPLGHTVAHNPQPTHRPESTRQMSSTMASAPNWHRSRQSPQTAQAASSTTATKPELTMAGGMPNSATLRRMPQQQVQQLQM
jgi:hypothetical protein